MTLHPLKHPLVFVSPAPSYVSEMRTKTFFHFVFFWFPYLFVCPFRLGDENIRQICKNLRFNTSLTRLHLNNNNITSLADISKALRQTVTLKEITLSGNYFADFRSLAKVLATNTTLRVLDLSDCNLETADCKPLGSALRANTSLQSLGMASNHIELSGAKYILAAAAVHPLLSYLDLSANHLGSEGAHPAVSLLERNPNITTLHMSHNGLSEEDNLLIEDLANNNQGLKDGVEISPRILHFPIHSLGTNVRVMRSFTISNIRSQYITFSILTNAPETTAMSPFVGYLSPSSSVDIHVLVMGEFPTADAASHLLVCRIAVVDPRTVDPRPEDFWRRQQITRSYRSTYLQCIGMETRPKL